MLWGGVLAGGRCGRRRLVRSEIDGADSVLQPLSLTPAQPLHIKFHHSVPVCLRSPKNTLLTYPFKVSCPSLSLSVW